MEGWSLLGGGRPEKVARSLLPGMVGEFPQTAGGVAFCSCVHVHVLLFLFILYMHTWVIANGAGKVVTMVIYNP